jgi:hypothetical protein
VLRLLEHGAHGVAPTLLVADPSDEHISQCRQEGLACPPVARVQGAILSDGLAEAWERRVRKLTRCDPMTGCNRRVVEANWQQNHPTSSGMQSGYWSLLLECGHEVKRRLRQPRKPNHVPQWATCCHCSRKNGEK